MTLFGPLTLNRFRCEDGNLMRHDPQHDDPYLETNVGKCPECGGKGCPDPGDDVEPFDDSEHDFNPRDRLSLGDLAYFCLIGATMWFAGGVIAISWWHS